MGDRSLLNNDARSSNILVKDSAISKDVTRLQVPQQLYTGNNSRTLPALPDPTYKEGRLMQAPSYLLGKPLYDFDATGNVVNITNLILV